MQYQWTTRGTTNWTAVFEVGEKRYEASFDEKEAGQDQWVYGFWQTYPRPTMGIAGTGDAGQVFSTVLKIGEDFIRQKRPAVITFSAMESNRRTLYQSMMRRFASSVNYTTSYDNNGNFTMTRNDEGTPNTPRAPVGSPTTLN
jgi:hypothetical protein